MKGLPEKGIVSKELSEDIELIYFKKRFYDDSVNSYTFRNAGIDPNRTIKKARSGMLTLTAAAKFLDVMGYKLNVKIEKK